MNYLANEIPTWIFYISYTIFLAASLIVIIKMVKTESIIEKVLGLDLITAIIMCFSALYAIQSNNTVYLEISLCISIIAFLGTVSFARYMERTNNK